MEIVPFHGWARNARLVCNDVEMIVTLDVGPRILGYGFVGGPNELHVNPKTAGLTGGDEFRSYGGHRVWIAPEERPRTFQPDNGPVEAWEEDGTYVFASAPDTFHIRKSMRIHPEPAHDRFVLVHRIENLGGYDAELGPWTPTQFAAGGELVFPQAPYIPHSERVLPARPLVLWHYTDMSDPRWTWGRRVIRLRQADAGPTKAGALVQQGIAAYANHGNVYLRRFEYVEDAVYPDLGCNFEVFSRSDMLEVESMSPMTVVRKNGGFVDHREVWYLLRDAAIPRDDDACGEWLDQMAEQYPFA